MQRIALTSSLLALAMGSVVACGDDDSPPDPTGRATTTTTTGGGGTGAGTTTTTTTTSGMGGMAQGGGGMMPMAVCGDGLIEDAEACDDGGTADGDGCNSMCQIEAGYECTGEPSTCTVDCGDGTLLAPEECDDMNEAAGDGCSDTCTVEDGFVCPTPGQACVPLDGSCMYRFDVALTDNAGTLEGQATGDTTGETDDVSVAACDGTDSGDAPDLIYGFELTDTRDVAISLDATYDGLVRLTGATCDLNSEIPEPGAAEGCANSEAAGTAETLSYNALPAGQYYVVVDGATSTDVGTFTLDISAAPTTCGDGTVDANELCDDGNTMAADGCSAQCDIEPGYKCSGEPSVCALACGDGIVDTGEECDDGNMVDMDRCDMSCALEFTVAEMETNDTTAMANPIMDGDIVKGSISVAGDTDVFELVLASDSWVNLETYTTIDGDSNNSDGFGLLAGLVDCEDDLDVAIFDASGDVTDQSTALIYDDFAGDGICGFLGPAQDGAAAFLPAGTYYARVDDFDTSGTISQYILDVQLQAPLGAGATCDPALDLCDPSQGLACDATGMTCQAPPVDRASYEAFSTGDAFDLDNTQVTYLPIGNSYHAYATTGIAAYPDTPGSGTTTSNPAVSDDDGTEEYTFGGGFTFPFFGTGYTSVFLNGNGNLTFGAGDGDFDATVADHFDQPRISFFFDDLSPQNGTVTVDEFADRVTITYDSVPEYFASNDNDFQIQLFDDGRIVVTYLNVDATSGIIGVSAGDALGNPPAETDFSALVPTAPAMGNLVINEYAADPNPGNDANCDGTVDSFDDEFVELVNNTGGPLDLTGVTLADGAGVKHTFASTILPAGQAVVIYGGGASQCLGVLGELASTGGLGLNNGGDTVTLSTGDTQAFPGTAPDGPSLTRDPDLTGAFVDHTTATNSGGAVSSPGFRVDGSPF